MNIGLLCDLLDTEHGIDLYEFSPIDRRKIWEKSHFHFGINGYDKSDAEWERCD